MTVAELIAELKKVDQTLEVIVNYDGCCYVEIRETAIEKDKYENSPYELIIRT